MGGGRALCLQHLQCAPHLHCPNNPSPQALLTRVCGLTAEAAGAALAEEVLKGGAAARVAAKVLAKVRPAACVLP